jgi:hypothetical protein
LAAAAALVIGVALMTGGILLDDRAGGPGTASTGEAALEIGNLMSASRELEGVLQNPALKSRVLTPREAAHIVVLEDGIAVIDARLAEPWPDLPSDQAMALWSDRVGLLDELLQVRGGSPPAAHIQRANNANGEGRVR